MDTLVSLAIRFPLSGLVGDLHPLDITHAEHTKNTIGKFANRYYSLLYFFNKFPSYKEFVALIGYLAFIYLTSVSTFAIFAISY